MLMFFLFFLDNPSIISIIDSKTIRISLKDSLSFVSVGIYDMLC